MRYLPCENTPSHPPTLTRYIIWGWQRPWEVGGWRGQAGGQPAKLSSTFFRIVSGGPGAGLVFDGFRLVFFGWVSIVDLFGVVPTARRRISIAQTRPSSGARAALASIVVEVVVCGGRPGLHARAAADPKPDPVSMCLGLVTCLWGGCGEDFALDLHQRRFHDPDAPGTSVRPRFRSVAVWAPAIHLRPSWRLRTRGLPTAVLPRGAFRIPRPARQPRRRRQLLPLQLRRRPCLPGTLAAEIS